MTDKTSETQDPVEAQAGQEGPTLPVRVVIADDHPIVRDGLRHALAAPDIEVVGEAATGKEALAAVHLLKPHILILDIRMPDMDGLAALRAVKETCPLTAVVIFTSYEDVDYLREAVLQGAAGYVLKATGSQELLATVRRVADGDTVIDPSTLGRILGETGAAERLRGGLAAEAPENLTRRELQMLRCVRAGLKNADIAALLRLSSNTVKVHCHRLYKKIGVSDRTQAILWADRHGIRPDP